MASTTFYPEAEFVVERRDGSQQTLRVRVEKLVCFGWAGRGREKVLKHVEEAAKLGIPAPKTVPELYVVPPYLLYSGDLIESYSELDSGEVEYVLVFDSEGRTYVTVGSDHTDRVLERVNIEASKRVCPKVVARTAWAFEDVVDHWDDLVLRSWTTVEGRRVLYQEDTLRALLRPEDLVKELEKRGFATRNMVVFSGTIPTKEGRIFGGEEFEFELEDPVLRRSIRHKYRVVKFSPR